MGRFIESVFLTKTGKKRYFFLKIGFSPYDTGVEAFCTSLVTYVTRGGMQCICGVQYGTSGVALCISDVVCGTNRVAKCSSLVEQ